MSAPNAKTKRNAKIVRLASQGWKFAAIGRRFGISRQRVEQIVKPVRARARMSVKDALNCGRIKRPLTCEGCGGEGPIESHHEDYAKPLEVDWLCRPCHKRAHRGEARRRQTRRRVVIECEGCGQEFRLPPSHAEQRSYCSQECSRRSQERSTIPAADLLADLRRLAAKLDRTPTQHDINELGAYSHTTYYNHFGSLTEAVNLAGLPVYGDGGSGHVDVRVSISSQSEAA